MKTKEKIMIRKAQPTLKEGLVYAQCLDQASEGFFKSILGEYTAEMIAHAFVHPNNEYSYENVSVMEVNGQIAGMVSGYTLKEKQAFDKNPLSHFAMSARLRLILFNAIAKMLSYFLGPQKPKDYYLQAMAIKKEMRGKGLGQKLLEHSLNTAIEKEAYIMSLDVSSKNKNAIKSYQKFGMQPPLKSSRLFHLTAAFVRMEIVI